MLLNLEPQLGEEPLRFSSLELLFEDLSGFDGGVLALGGVLNHVWGDAGLEVDVQRVSCWHQVVVVDELDESLHLRSLLSGLLRGALGDLTWVLRQTHNESVSVWSGVGAIVVVSDNDSLLTGISSGQKNDNLVVLKRRKEKERKQNY